VERLQLTHPKKRRPALRSIERGGSDRVGLRAVRLGGVSLTVA
jgi:hypothetical protein